MPTYDDIVERPPTWAKAVTELCTWSDNYDNQTPFDLFCDLIGFSGEKFGMAFYMPGRLDDGPPHVAMARLIDSTLRLRELELLGRALMEYTERPLEVKAWVRLITTYTGEIEDTDDIDPDDDERCTCGHGRVLDHIPGDVYPACLAIVDHERCPCERYTPAGEA